jgi:hypothetical protein
MKFGPGQFMVAVMAWGHDFFSSQGSPEKSGEINLPLPRWMLSISVSLSKQSLTDAD